MIMEIYHAVFTGVNPNMITFTSSNEVRWFHIAFSADLQSGWFEARNSFELENKSGPDHPKILCQQRPSRDALRREVLPRQTIAETRF